MDKNEVIDFWVKDLILTVIGGLIIAFIIGEGSLFQGKSLLDRAENLKATIVVRQSMCTIEVQNNLLVPIKVSVDGAYIWTLEAGSTQKIKGSFENKILSFESETPYAGGMNFSGHFVEPVVENGVYPITSRIGDLTYYLVDITNKSDFTCDVYVDKGYASEAYLGKITGKQEGFRSGYFRVYKNSNIVALCPDNQFYYFGEYGDKEVRYRVADYVEQETGLLQWTMRAP